MEVHCASVLAFLLPRADEAGAGAASGEGGGVHRSITEEDIATGRLGWRESYTYSTSTSTVL